jgi:alkylation response protein AidB-like acyl-CoA dehydrogenase
MASSFQGVDFYDLDSLLSDEERMIRDTVREWVDDHVMPVIQEAYIGRSVSPAAHRGMGELGMLGANLPEEYGCAGLNNVAYGLIMQELERGDSGSGPSPPCRGPWSCTRSTPSARRSTGRNGCRSSPAARRSDASASPNRTTGRTPAE